MKIKRNIKASSSVSPFKKEEFMKQLQDELYDAFIQLARTPEWGFEDIGEIDDLLMPIIEIEDYKGDYDRDLRIEFRGEVNYSELMDVCDSFNNVIQKYDKSAYFEPVEPGIAEAFIRTNVEACSNVTASLNYVTPEMEQLKRAVSKIYVDNDDQFHELVDSLLDNKPINLVPETRALKRAIDSLVVDSEEEKRTLVYEVAKDLGVIKSSTEIKTYTFDESEDGWGEDVEDILSQVFARAEDLMYEVRNTVRGGYTDCETVEDLADFIRQLASEFEEAADEIESL